MNLNLSHAEIERLMDEDPDDREIRAAHGFTTDDDWEDESLLCRFGCGLSYPDIASGKIRKCRGPLCGREIRYVTPLGDPGSDACDLGPGHEGDCGSSQLLLRPANAQGAPAAVTTAQGDVVSDSAYAEANLCALADVVAQYRELREARAKLAAVETLAHEVFGAAKHTDYGNGRWDVADRIMRILDAR